MDGYQTADGNTQYADIKRNASTQCVDNRNHTKDHYVPRIKLGILALYLLDKPYYNENIVYLSLSLLSTSLLSCLVCQSFQVLFHENITWYNRVSQKYKHQDK